MSDQSSDHAGLRGVTAGCVVGEAAAVGAHLWYAVGRAGAHEPTYHFQDQGAWKVWSAVVVVFLIALLTAGFAACVRRRAFGGFAVTQAVLGLASVDLIIARWWPGPILGALVVASTSLAWVTRSPSTQTG